MRSISKYFCSSKELDHSWIMGIWVGPTANIYGGVDDWLYFYYPHPQKKNWNLKTLHQSSRLDSKTNMLATFLPLSTN